MSDTPRTNAEWQRVEKGGEESEPLEACYIKMTEHARRLERELATLKAQGPSENLIKWAKIQLSFSQGSERLNEAAQFILSFPQAEPSSGLIGQQIWYRPIGTFWVKSIAENNRLDGYRLVDGKWVEFSFWLPGGATFTVLDKIPEPKEAK